MSQQFARLTRTRGPWMQKLLVAHARAISETPSEELLRLTKSSRQGRMIVLDSPSPARGYAILPEGDEELQLHVAAGEPDEAFHALFGEIAERSGYAQHVVVTEDASPDMQLAIVNFGSRYGIHLSDDRAIAAAPEAEVTPESAPEAEVTPESAPEAEVTPESAPEAEVTPESAPEVEVTPESAPEVEAESAVNPQELDIDSDDWAALVSESRYARMRRPQLESIAKERSIFIPKKVDDLRRALLESDGVRDESEPYED